MNATRHLIPAAAATGVLVSILALADITLPCQTTGCALYSGIKIAGVSPYLLSTVGFAAILLCWAVSRYRSEVLFLLRWLLVTGVLISSAFLLWQNLFWPCTTCLLIALAMGVAAAAGLTAVPACRTKPLAAALVLWTALFLPASVAAGKEALLTPAPLLGSAQAPVRIFFSPTCPACEKVVTEALENPGLLENLALIPIAKGEEDLRRLAAHFAAPAPVAELFQPVAGTPPPLSLRKRLEIARNKMVLASLGATSVPIVMAPRLITAPVQPTTEGTLEELYQRLFPDQHQLYDQNCDLQEAVESTCSP